MSYWTDETKKGAMQSGEGKLARFKTIEISNPRFEANGLRFITVKSPNLKGRGDICVYVPPHLEKADVVPVVILLHGVYGSAWSWPFNAGVHMRLDEMIRTGEMPPMILAMPSDGLWGDGSAYLPHGGYNFEKWIADDVVDVVTSCIDGAGKSSPLFIAGQSMGGFGALRIGARYGYKFKGMSGLSSITSLPQIKLFVQESLKSYVQQDIINEDLLATFKYYRHQLPPMRFDCGSSDMLIKYNRELHQKMEREGLLHTYEEYAGGHEWNYWSEHIIKSLKFFAGLL